MHSLPNLLLYLFICTSFLDLSRAAPAAACMVSYYVTTIYGPAESVPSTSIPSTSSSSTSSALSTGIHTVSSSVDPQPQSSSTPSTLSVVPPTSTSTTPTLPTNGGGTELPSPTAALKFVTVGRGVQNYTCSAPGAIPVAIGALAVLYDFTSLAYSSPATLNTVPPTIVYTPISSANGTTLAVNGVGTFPMIGNHYFSADGTPTFSLSSVGDILFCTKLASVNAPASANIGPDGTGAVPWLMLGDKGGSVGLSQVYRVVTAGGKAPATCQNTDLISIDYAAEYWFFG